MHDLIDTMKRRRMIRSFSTEPLDAGLLDQLLDTARRAPSAGHTQAVQFLVLDSTEAVARYWDLTLPEPRRATFRWSSLLDAPALIVVLTRPQAYVERYAEPDKTRPNRTGPDKAGPDERQTRPAANMRPDLGGGTDNWSIPFWWVDAGTVIQNLLLLVTGAELGACLFGLFEHEPAVLDAFGVPPGWRGVATIAVGHPLDNARDDAESGRSAQRRRAPIAELIHRGHW